MPKFVTRKGERVYVDDKGKVTKPPPGAVDPQKRKTKAKGKGKKSGFKEKFMKAAQGFFGVGGDAGRAKSKQKGRTVLGDRKSQSKQIEEAFKAVEPKGARKKRKKK